MSSQEENKYIGAKILSKFSMIFATVWIAVGTVLKALKVFDIDVGDIVYSGIAIVAIWSPTYLSIYLDKIREIRFGK